MKKEKLPEAFISYAAGILADTSTGLNRSEIVKQCTKYAVKYGVDIPVATTDWGDFGSKVKNKRTAMFQNLSVFSKDEQVVIIKELTELPFFSQNVDAQQLRRTLLNRYDTSFNKDTKDLQQGVSDMSEHVPKAFISYSWEDEEHKAWIKSFADRLLDSGIDATVDQYDLELGDRLPQFMEQSVTNSDYVLIVCTPAYKKKSDNRKGGVGYEGHIISGEIFSKGNERKFIPIIRKGTAATSMPNCLAGKLGIDLSDGEKYEQNFQDLITTMLGKKRKPRVKPAIDVSPSATFSRHKESEEEPIHILGIITDEVTVPRMDGTRGSALYKIPFRLSKTPSSLWNKIFISQWNNPPRFTTMHRPGIASVSGDEIILNGTTIEEVQAYHRDTLVLCVEEANKIEKQMLEEQKRKTEAETNRRNQHYANVSDIASKIQF